MSRKTQAQAHGQLFYQLFYRYMDRSPADHLAIAPRQELYYSVKDFEAETTLDDLTNELRYIRRLYSRYVQDTERKSVVVQDL